MATENLFFHSLIQHYEAQKAEALATLSLYFSNPVGVGEHSDIQAELIKWTEILANAEDCIETLKSNFTDEEKDEQLNS